MKNKRILVVIDSLGYGGAERLVVSLLPYIEKYNYKFDVMVLFSDLSLKPEIELSGINVITLNQDYADRWSVLRLFYYFRAAVVDKKYDIIHIDGGHSHEVAEQDIKNCKKHSKENTILIIDDAYAPQIERLISKYIKDRLFKEIDYDALKLKPTKYHRMFNYL